MGVEFPKDKKLIKKEINKIQKIYKKEK